MQFYVFRTIVTLTYDRSGCPHGTGRSSLSTISTILPAPGKSSPLPFRSRRDFRRSTPDNYLPEPEKRLPDGVSLPQPVDDHVNHQSPERVERDTQPFAAALHTALARVERQSQHPAGKALHSRHHRFKHTSVAVDSHHIVDIPHVKLRTEHPLHVTAERREEHTTQRQTKAAKRGRAEGLRRSKGPLQIPDTAYITI